MTVDEARIEHMAQRSQSPVSGRVCGARMRWDYQLVKPKGSQSPVIGRGCGTLIDFNPNTDYPQLSQSPVSGRVCGTPTLT